MWTVDRFDLDVERIDVDGRPHRCGRSNASMWTVERIDVDVERFDVDGRMHRCGRSNASMWTVDRVGVDVERFDVDVERIDVDVERIDVDVDRIDGRVWHRIGVDGSRRWSTSDHERGGVSSTGVTSSLKPGRDTGRICAPPLAPILSSG
jgi:hypothetical protein